MSEVKLPKLDEAIERIDNMMMATGFSSDHPLLKDWVAIRFALKDAEKQKAWADIAYCPNGDLHDWIIYHTSGVSNTDLCNNCGAMRASARIRSQENNDSIRLACALAAEEIRDVLRKQTESDNGVADKSLQLILTFIDKAYPRPRKDHPDAGLRDLRRVEDAVMLENMRKMSDIGTPRFQLPDGTIPPPIRRC